MSRSAWVWSGLLLWASACTQASSSPPDPQILSLEDLHRQVLAPGIERIEARVIRPNAAVGNLVAIYAEPPSIRAELLINDQKRPLKELSVDALGVVNAGYFTRDWHPTGLLHSQGRTLNPLVREGGPAGSGVLLMNESGVEIQRRESVRKEDLARATLALQAGPRIIEPDGSPGIRSDDGARANRTVVGRDVLGRLVVLVVYAPDAGISSGATLFELQRLLGKGGLGEFDPNLALTAALNLDGGPSTGLYLHEGKPPLAYAEASRVYSALVLRIAP